MKVKKLSLSNLHKNLQKQIMKIKKLALSNLQKYLKKNKMKQKKTLKKKQNKNK